MRVLLITTLLLGSWPLQWSDHDLEQIKTQLESGHAGPAFGGFRFHVLLVTPEINEMFDLGYNLESFAIVRMGFQAAFGREVPTFNSLDNKGLLKSKKMEIKAERIEKPLVILPGKPKGKIFAATSGPNDVEIYFPIEEGFWNLKEVEFRYHVQGMSFKKKLKVRNR